MKNEKYMILGTSRGGTTILAATLGSHSGIAVLDEDMTGGLNHIIGNKIPAVKLCIPNQIELKKRWHALYKVGMLNGLFRKSMTMNKIPKSSLSIQDYNNFGRIRHVCILRHPAGVIPAIINRENKKQAVAAYRWKRCLEIFKTMDKNDTYDPLFVSFEKLVTMPETTLKNLCSSLNLPFDAQMLNAPKHNERYNSKGFDSAKARYENQENIWDILPATSRHDYESINRKTV